MYRLVGCRRLFIHNNRDYLMRRKVHSTSGVKSLSAAALDLV